MMLGMDVPGVLLGGQQCFSELASLMLMTRSSRCGYFPKHVGTMRILVGGRNRVRWGCLEFSRRQPGGIRIWEETRAPGLWHQVIGPCTTDTLMAPPFSNEELKNTDAIRGHPPSSFCTAVYEFRRRFITCFTGLQRLEPIYP